MMDQRVSLITLGVQDIKAEASFYDALGWQRVDTQDGVIAYDLIGQTLGLYPLAKLSEDLGVDIAHLGRGAMTLGHNVADKADVSRLITLAARAGAEILKPAQDVFWGGHHGYFADPEGHIWEVAYNPFSPLSGQGHFRWNGYA